MDRTKRTSVASPAPADNAYLLKKGVKAHGARVHEGALVIPMRDGEELHSLQFIDAAGDKRFLTGGRVTGCYFSVVKPEGPLEGFATGCAVAIAFNAGNVWAVARAAREVPRETADHLCR